MKTNLPKMSLVLLFVSVTSHADVTKEAFSKAFIPPGHVFCKNDKGMFKKCYSLTDDACEKEINATSEQCLSSLVPPVVPLDQAREIGDLVMQCTMRRFAGNKKNVLNKTDECQKFGAKFESWPATTSRQK